MNFKAIQTEIDAAYLYQKLAEKESDPNIAEVFRQMSEIEKGHAMGFLKRKDPGAQNLPKPSRRARILNLIGKTFGYDYVLGVLLDTEKKLAAAVISSKRRLKLESSGVEANHVKILNTLIQGGARIPGSTFARFEKRHSSVGGNALRAAVLGGNDGLISNFSLIMGVAGAIEGAGTVLLTGIAGLLAGALSMSLGEWISVKSSQELYENQIQLETEELEEDPEGEMKELKLIYMAKGMKESEADALVHELMKDKDSARSALITEELGIDPDELKGSAMEAALYSFIMFAIGAIIPVIPYFFTSGTQAIILSSSVSAIGLFLIGAAITLYTGKSVWYSGFRQVVFGLLAAAISFGIGKLIGVSIVG